MSQYEIGGYLEYRKQSFHLILAILLVAAGCTKKGGELSSSDSLDSIANDSASPLTIEEPTPLTAVVDKKVSLAGYCLRDSTVFFNGDIIEQAPIACANGSFRITLTVTPENGVKKINIRQLAGKKLLSASIQLYSDVETPRIAISSPAANSAVGSSVMLQGTCQESLPLTVSFASQSSTVNCNNGNFETTLSLSSVADGNVIINFEQTAVSGTKGTASLTVVKDTGIPAIAISEPAANATVGSSFVLKGTCQSSLPVVIKMNSKDYTTPCSSGSFATTLSLTGISDGNVSLALEQTSATGNKGTASLTIKKNTAVPVIAISTPAANAAAGADVILQGTCQASLNVLITVGSKSYTTTCTSGNFATTVSLTGNNDGNVTIGLAQTSATGVTGTASVTVKKDTVAPVVKITSPASGAAVPVTTTVSGTCEAGLIVAIAGAGVSAPVNVTCASGGTFSSSVTVTSATGNKVIDISQTDAAGNKGSASTTVSYTATGPAIAFSTPAESSYFKTTVPVTGTCQSGLTITFSGAGWVSPATTTCASGTFSATVTFTSGDGVKNLIASQTNGSNQTGAASRSFIRDETAPVVSIMSPDENLVTKTATLQLAGACEKGNANPVVVSGSVTASSNLTCSNGAFTGSITLSATDGVKTVKISQTDAAGNTGTASRSFTLDTKAPTLAFTSPAENTSSNGSVTVKGSCEAGLDVTIAGTGVASSSTTTCSSGTFSKAVSLSSTDGTKTVQISQTDAAGNTGTASRNFVLDTKAPALTFTSPAAGTSAKANLTIKGTCESNLTVTVGGTGATSATASCTSGAFSVDVSFSSGDGDKLIQVSQTDAAGNTGSASRTFKRDNVAPTLSFTSPAANTAAETGLTIVGTCENGLTVIVAGSGISATQGDCPSGSFSIGVTFTSGDGTKTVQVSQTDTAGNTGSASRNFARVTPSLDGATLYANNCSLCHNSLASSTKLNSSAAVITSAISSISSMSSLSNLKALTSAQISAIAEALVTAPVETIGLAANTIVPLGNRTYMESLFNEIFVSSTSDTNITTLTSSLLNQQIVALGGPCLKYDSSCNSSQVDTAPFALGSPAGNTMRKGYVTRACDQILEIDKAVTNALGKAGLNVNSTIDATNVQAMFKLFNPGKTAPTTVINSLISVGAAAKGKSYSTTNQWRFTLLPLCLSSTMDIL